MPHSSLSRNEGPRFESGRRLVSWPGFPGSPDNCVAGRRVYTVCTPASDVFKRTGAWSRCGAGARLPQREDVRAHCGVVVSLQQLDGAFVRDVERIRCGVGDECVSVVADELRRSGLEQAMSDDDLRPDEFPLSGDVLDHERTRVQHELEVEQGR